MAHEETDADRAWRQRRLLEEQKMAAATPGFWVVAGPFGVCDQALSMEIQRARFYCATLPEGLRQSLPEASRKGPGREKPFEATLDAALSETARESMGVHPELDQKLEAFAHARSGGESLRDAAGASFGYHVDPDDSHWGALVLGWDDLLFTPEKVDDFWDASEASRAVSIEASKRCAQLVLDHFERVFGLEPSAMSHAVDHMHAFWGANDSPSCQLGDSNKAAASLLEKQQLGDEAATPPRAPRKANL